jgi:hypothetical protein
MMENMEISVDKISSSRSLGNDIKPSGRKWQKEY